MPRILLVRRLHIAGNKSLLGRNWPGLGHPSIPADPRSVALMNETRRRSIKRLPHPDAVASFRRYHRDFHDFPCTEVFHWELLHTWWSTWVEDLLWKLQKRLRNKSNSEESSTKNTLEVEEFCRGRVNGSFKRIFWKINVYFLLCYVIVGVKIVPWLRDYFEI